MRPTFLQLKQSLVRGSLAVFKEKLEAYLKPPMVLHIPGETDDVRGYPTPSTLLDKDESGLTLLHWAVFYNRHSKIEHLLRCAAEYKVTKRLLNAADNNDVTPLMFAVEYGSLRTMELLLEMGVDCNAQDKWGRSALIKAVEKGSWYMVYFLLKHKANPRARTTQGQTALHIAAAPKPDRSHILSLLAVHYDTNEEEHKFANVPPVILSMGAAQPSSRQEAQAVATDGSYDNFIDMLHGLVCNIS